MIMRKLLISSELHLFGKMRKHAKKLTRISTLIRNSLGRNTSKSISTVGFQGLLRRARPFSSKTSSFSSTTEGQKNGYVDGRTRIEIQTGFTQENFKRKQIQADKNFAKRLQNKERNRSHLYQLSQALERRENLEGEELSRFDQELLRMTNQLGEDISDLRERLNIHHQHRHKSKKKPASKSLVQCLPERIFSKKVEEEGAIDEEANVK